MILVLVYIKKIILCSTGKIPFTCNQTKIVNFLDNKKLKDKKLKAKIRKMPI